jgi:hypothetical protein
LGCIRRIPAVIEDIDRGIESLADRWVACTSSSMIFCEGFLTDGQLESARGIGADDSNAAWIERIAITTNNSTNLKASPVPLDRWHHDARINQILAEVFSTRGIRVKKIIRRKYARINNRQ